MTLLTSWFSDIQIESSFSKLTFTLFVSYLEWQSLKRQPALDSRSVYQLSQSAYKINPYMNKYGNDKEEVCSLWPIYLHDNTKRHSYNTHTNLLATIQQSSSRLNFIVPFIILSYLSIISYICIICLSTFTPLPHLHSHPSPNLISSFLHFTPHFEQHMSVSYCPILF